MKVLSALALVAAVSPVSALATVDKDVTDCEFYVDDFAVVGTGAYGSGSTALVAHLTMRKDLDRHVVAAGAVFNVHGVYTKRQTDSDGSTRTETWSSDEGIYAPGTRTMDGQRLEISFSKDWDSYGNDIGERTVKDFTYYVTVRQAGEYVTYWFKDNGNNLSAESISSDRYYYSESVFLGGYSTARYLWRDSGSPVFSNRARCLGR